MAYRNKEVSEVDGNRSFQGFFRNQPFGSDVYDGKRHGGFYTQEDLKEIVDYAAKRHITIIPEVSMPGHASAAIASYPWLGTSGKQIKVPGKFGVHYEVFNVADPDVMKFLDEVTDEVIAIFPGSVFHIGGDEVKYDQWKNSPAIRAYMTKHNLKTRPNFRSILQMKYPICWQPRARE